MRTEPGVQRRRRRRPCKSTNRYREILDSRKVDLAATAEALAARPTDVQTRFNHALALLQAGR